MADAKISALTALTALAKDDLLPVVDTSATTTKKTALSDFGIALPAFPGLSLLTGLAYKQAISLTVGAADLTIYTCPAGKKAMVGLCGSFNPTGGSITATLRILISGTSYRMGTATAVGAGVQSFLGLNHHFLLEAGQALVVNATAAGLAIFPVIIEFDDTVNFRTVRNNALSNGDNTLYTVPVGKSAVLFNPSISNNSIIVGGVVGIANESGGSLNYTVYAVPSGQVVGTSFQVAALTAVANNAYSITTFNLPTLTAGDFIVVNSSSGNAGQSANIAVFEV